MRRRAFVAIATFAALLAAFVATSISAAPPPVGYATSAAEYDLIAGQSTTVGHVYVWDWAGKVYVEFVTDANWCITETHVAVGVTKTDIPHTATGNPIPGQFPAGETFSTCQGAAGPYVLDAPTGTSWVVAAHAVVWDKTSQTTTNVVSRPGVALVGGGTAVASTEPGVAVNYPNCPDGDNDAISSLWDSNAKLPGNVIPDWGTADWIWNAAYPPFDKNVTGEVVGFSDTFNIGWPVSGSLMITTDNAYRAVFNGGAVGQAQLGPGFPTTLKETVLDTAPQTGDWGVASQGWQSVEQYALSGLKVGANTLGITAANEYMWNDGGFSGADFYLGTWDPSGPPINADSAGNDRCINPAGLIYKLSVENYTHNETAWGAGTRFVERGNWATYMEYTKGDGTITFTQNVTNTLWDMAFFVTDSPDGGSMMWLDNPPPSPPGGFGTAAGPANCYSRTGTAPDFAQFSGAFTSASIPVAPTATDSLIGVKEGAYPTGGAVRVRVGTPATTNCVANAFPNTDINGPLTKGAIHIYYP